jgi:DNA-binding HxlR family transcriptional regulator
MRSGPVRLGQLGRIIPLASRKALTENLRKLESAGLISRTDLGGRIRHVEYDLVEPVKLGTYLLLDRLAEWQTIYETMMPNQNDA